RSCSWSAFIIMSSLQPLSGAMVIRKPPVTQLSDGPVSRPSLRSSPAVIERDLSLPSILGPGFPVVLLCQDSNWRGCLFSWSPIPHLFDPSTALWLEWMGQDTPRRAVNHAHGYWCRTNTAA